MSAQCPNNGSCRIMTYSHDGFGLGHLRRTTNIASCLVRESPETSVLMLVGCSLGAFFDLPPGVDFIKIPSIIKVDNGVYHPLSLRVSVEEMKALRASIMKKAAYVFQPDLFLVDHVPTGVWGELRPTLKMLNEREDRPAVVLGMRDIVDDPRAVQKLWRREKTYKAISDYYDEVLIYGCREVFDMAAEYGLDTELGSRIRYCGYICSDEPRMTDEQTRNQLQLRKDRLVVVSAGGGYDAYPMMRTCMEALQLLGNPLPFDALFITGPLMLAEHQQSLRRQAEGLQVRVLSHVQDKPSYMSASDLMITMAGYNSLSEVLRLRKKALVVPRLGPRAEQMMRARLFAERGLVDAIYPHEVSPRVLAYRIMADLERTDFPVFDPVIQLDGGRQAAVRLVELTRARVATLS